jgi:hypothetical protein
MPCLRYNNGQPFRDFERAAKRDQRVWWVLRGLDLCAVSLTTIAVLGELWPDPTPFFMAAVFMIGTWASIALLVHLLFAPLWLWQRLILGEGAHTFHDRVMLTLLFAGVYI